MTNTATKQKTTETQRLAGLLVSYVASHDFTSFTEAVKFLAPHIPVTGEHAICRDDAPNFIIACGLSQEASDVIRFTLAHKMLEVVPVSFMVYMVDGGIPDLPMWRGHVSPERLVNPHWTPTALRLYGSHARDKAHSQTTGKKRQHRTQKAKSKSA